MPRPSQVVRFEVVLDTGAWVLRRQVLKECQSGEAAFWATLPGVSVWDRRTKSFL